MNDLNRDWLTNKLQDILTGIKENESDDYNWYGDLLWNDFDEKYENAETLEDYFAIEAVKYPELHDTMRKIVRALTEINDQNWGEAVMVNEE